jgi:hypothetical protein
MIPNLNYIISINEKIYTFFDIPISIIQKIFELLKYRDILNLFLCNKELDIYLSHLFSEHIIFTKLLDFYKTKIRRFSYKKYTRSSFSFLYNLFYDPFIEKVYKTEDLPFLIEVLYIKKIETSIFHLNNLSKLEVKVFDLNCNYLPQSLRQLKIFKLETNLRNLPFKLKKLIIEKGYNESLSNLPNSLKHLETGKDFNRSLYGIPNNLTCLNLGDEFNREISILSNVPLKTLKIGKLFNACISNLPSTLIHLELENSGKSIDISNTKLIYFSLGKFSNQDFKEFPNTLKTLIIEEEFIDIISFSMSFCK